MTARTGVNPGAIIEEAFYDELSKHSAFIDQIDRWRGKATSAYKAVKQTATDIGERSIKMDRIARTEAEITGRIDPSLDRSMPGARQAVDDAPLTRGQKRKVEENQHKTNRFATGAAILGLGGLGFGYHEYKKNADDQFARINPQISRG